MYRNTNECDGARIISNGVKYFRYCTDAQELTNVKERELSETERSISGNVQVQRTNKCQGARNI